MNYLLSRVSRMMVVIGCGLGIVVGTCSVSHAQDGTRIAFNSFRDGTWGIFVMDPDGSNQTRLTSGGDSEPKFSPDGSKIAFTSSRDGDSEIYVMNADGSNQTRLTYNAAPDGSPSFSPDGIRIVFHSYRDGSPEIYVMNSDGSNETRLTTNLNINLEPSFSPDGTKIVFRSFRDNNNEIYVMNADGSDQTRLTNDPAQDILPTFSPNGAKIAFSFAGSSGSGIGVMDSDGGNRTTVTDNPPLSSGPSFSPDGTKIAFHAQQDGNGNQEIYVVDADGSNQSRLTYNSTADGRPSWGVEYVPTDTTPPTIEITSPTGSVYTLNQFVTADYNCTDDLSGVAACDGTTVNGATLDTSSVGSRTFIVTSSDLAGNVSSTAVDFSIGYGISVLFDQSRAYKSGSTVPIRIKLVDAYGVDVSSQLTVVHAVSIIQTSSQASTTLDDAGSANPDFDFRYEPGSGIYIFNLKTTGYGTGSYQLTFVVGSSPTLYSVDFQVRQ